MSRAAWVAVAALAGLLSGCGQDPDTSLVAVSGGNGSETTNGFSLRVINLDGTPAPGAKVNIRLSDSLAGHWGDSLVGGLRTRLDTVSDATGLVRIGRLVRGNFTVSLAQGTDRSLARQSADPGLPYGGTVQLGQAGAPRLQDGRLAGCRITLFGVDVKADADETGFVQFDSLATGTYSFRAWKNGVRIGDGVMTVQTGTSASILSFTPSGKAGDPTSFAHALAISLDASVARGNIRSTLGRFPLPLLLDKSTFDFAGADPLALRFIDPSGKALPYAVESWDSLAGQARIWFRMDSVVALQAQQVTQLYWKGPVQPASAPVFDTADGWWGAWHLRQTLADATPYGRDAQGTPAGVNGWYSNGTNSLRLPGLPSLTDSGFTVSLWILPDTDQRAEAPIVRQIPTDAGLPPFSLRMGPYSTWIAAHYPNGTDSQTVKFPTVAAPGEWLQIAVTYNRKRDEMRLYLNGQQWGGSATGLNASGLKLDGALVLGGSDSAGIGFKGLVKEVRLSNQPRPADWINAEYGVQRTAANSPFQLQRLR